MHDMTMVLVPSMKVFEVYSSMARLESPTQGTYLRNGREGGREGGKDGGLVSSKER